MPNIEARSNNNIDQTSAKKTPDIKVKLIENLLSSNKTLIFSSKKGTSMVIPHSFSETRGRCTDIFTREELTKGQPNEYHYNNLQDVMIVNAPGNETTILFDSQLQIMRHLKR